MNILASNSLSNFPPQFIFLKCLGADESMKDYAKMAILFALQEHPNDYPEMCRIIAHKFDEKYGGYWSCSIAKEGGSCFRCYDYFS